MGIFKIRVLNEKNLYDYLRKNEDVDFEKKECPSLEWTLNANIFFEIGEGIEITTNIEKKKNEYLPKAELQKNLSNYEIKSGPNRIFFEDETHFFNLMSDEKNYIISIEHVNDSFETFKEMLSLNNELVEKLVKSYCVKKNIEIPDFEYFLNIPKSPSENYYFKGIEDEIEIKDINVKFEDIGGNIEGKREMDLIYRDLVYPELAPIFGRDPNKAKGYLIYGEKGNGKTMLVKALATRLKEDLSDKIKFYQISYGNVSSIYRGGEADKISLLFELIKNNEIQGLTTLVFMDELQSVGIRKFDNNEVLDELLANLGGLHDYKKLVFIGATYCPLNQLDPALIRPGRLGKHIEIKLPSAEERKEIIEIYLNKEKRFIKEKAGFEGLFGQIDTDLISKETQNFNGSDIMMLFESVRYKKEEETLKKIRNFNDVEKIKDNITPISTDDFLEIIKKGFKDKKPAFYS